MEKMPVKQNHEYTVTCDGECNIYDYDTQALLHTHKEGEAQSHFTAIGMAVEYDNADAKLTLVFNSAPGGSSNGGNVEANLNVGHAAADAVAAVCTLTLGDLGTGGTLADSNGQSVELDAPHAYAAGSVDIADATAAGTIAFGEHEAIEFEAKTDAKAYGTFATMAEEGEAITVTNGGIDCLVPVPAYPDYESVDVWNAAFTAAGCGIVCTAVEAVGEVVVSVEATDVGEAGNGIAISVKNYEPVTLAGGSTARTPQDVVDTLNASEDCPAVAVLSHVDEQDAKAVFTPLESYGPGQDYQLSIMEDDAEVNSWAWQAQEGDGVQELVDALNDLTGQLWENTNCIEASLEDGKVELRKLEAHGAASNGYSVNLDTNPPFEESEETPIQGGRDESNTITFTAKEYGVNDTITITGDLFENQQGMSGGHGDYTVDELLEAISGEFTDITAAAGSAEGTITLTANTAGKAANTITYTATGCFGSGTTRQGSTTRGKDAVEQTEYKIYLNGAELDVEPAPLPTALTPTTAMRNSGVYTVDAAIDATAITIPANATAEIWVRIGATTFNVTLPPSWVWVNGAASDMTGKTNTTFCIAVRSDGVKVLASITYSYDTTPAQS